MDDDKFNMSLRKFLKQVGVTSQREIERVVREKKLERRQAEGQGRAHRGRHEPQSRGRGRDRPRLGQCAPPLFDKRCGGGPGLPSQPDSANYEVGDRGHIVEREHRQRPGIHRVVRRNAR